MTPATASQALLRTKLKKGLALHRQGQFDAARAEYQDVLGLDPRQFDALYFLGVLAAQTEDMPRAADMLRQAAEVNPNHAQAQHNLAAALAALNRAEDALAAYNKALALKPDYAEAHHGRGRMLANLRSYDDAVAAFTQAVALNPQDIEAQRNRGLILAGLHRHADAVMAFNAVLLLKPDDAHIHNAKGQSLHYLRRYEDALRAYDSALAINPNHAEAWSNRGAALAALKYLPAAVESYDRALTLKSNYAVAAANRGHALLDMSRFEDAAASYDRALRIAPDYAFLRGPRLHARLQACVWDDLDADLKDLETRIANGEKATPPWPALVMFDAPALHHAAAKTWMRSLHKPNKAIIAGRSPGSKIRLAYFSADFHDHATTHLMAELFERHDRGRFELIAFSFGPNKQDAMRARVTAAFDQFLDVRDRSDDEVASLARSLNIDIAIDLKGYTQDSRPGIFACRAAPVQAAYIGYPGPMAADYMDYVIADDTVIPGDAEEDYSEQVVRLPYSYQVNDRKRVIADRAFSRAELGLPEQGFVFCCFNHSFKILPDTFAIWMRILKAVPRSVLWLLEDYAPAAINLRRHAAGHGVEPERLVFAKRMPLSDHLARLRVADLFLDTLPYNAHTTASDALWAGVPMLTRAGEAFAGRVAASLLKAMGMPELITSTAADYEERAITLASDPEGLARIKVKLASNRLTTPLFDTALFTRHLETAYERMLAHYHAGLPPEHISIAP